MKTAFIQSIFCLLFGIPGCGQAMTLERVNSDLFATGPTVDQDFQSFKDAFEKGGVKRLILVNGPGGDLWTGMQVAMIVQKANIKTVVSGSCMSACSLIFMGGQERTFGTGHLPRVTMVGIHGAHDKDTKQINARAMPQMYALYKNQMGEKFDAMVISQALYEIKEASGFLRIREIQRTLEKERTPWFCPTGQTPFDQCYQHKGKDAFTLGVITQTETEEINLPDSMQIQIGFFGRAVGTPAEDMKERIEKRMVEYCADQLPCKTIAQKALTNYLSVSSNKAMAIGWGKTGYGARWELDDPRQAMLGALYTCNHTKNNPKLCRLAAVNEHELLPLYEETQVQTAAALQNLTNPSPLAAQQERDEPGASTPKKMRYGNQVTGMTPKVLEGVQRWDTKDLVSALTRSVRPVVIDVGAAGPMIPGALNFIHAGIAYEDEKQETAYAERFRQMLQAAAPDLEQSVVFYCASSECWLSVNAAMRAHQTGYTQVIWYRGGLSAWIRAGLPTVGRSPVAILQ